MKEGYTPTKNDVESAYRMLATPGDWVSIDAIFDRLDQNMQRAGIKPAENWRIEVERKMAEYFGIDK